MDYLAALRGLGPNLDVLKRKHVGTKRDILRATRLRALTRVASLTDVLPGNVHGIAIRRKLVDGKPIDELAVTFHVQRKLPKKLLPRTHRLPAAVDGVPVDVVESRVPSVLWYEAIYRGILTGTVRPLEMGYSASHPRSLAGTLGAVAVADNRPDQPLVLSCQHVLAPVGAATNDPLIQPGRADVQGGALPVVARLVAATPPTPSMAVDAAVGLLTTHGANYFGPQIGMLADPRPLQVGTGTIVVKRGRTTDVTVGIVEGIAVHQNVRIDGPNGPTSIWYTNQLVISRGGGPYFSLPGDSGALVLERDSFRPVGLIVAGTDGNLTLATPIDRVLAAFESTLGPLRLMAAQP